MRPLYRLSMHSMLVIVGLGAASDHALALETDPDDQIPVVASFSPSGIIVGETSTFSWDSGPEATSCNISGVPGLGSFESTSGSINVSPSSDLAASVTCTGGGNFGSTTAALTVYGPPTVNASFDPNSIVVGESTTLSWSSTDASSCSADNGVSISGTNGSVSLSPSNDLTVTVMCTGPAGTGSDSASVTVSEVPPPLVDAFFSPSFINAGEHSWLNWSSQYATYCQAAGFSQPPNGAEYLGPFYFDTFETVTCHGDGGISSATAFLSVSSQSSSLSNADSSKADTAQSSDEVEEAIRAALGLTAHAPIRVKSLDLDANGLSDQLIVLPEHRQLLIRMQHGDGFRVAKAVKGVTHFKELAGIRVRTNLDGQSTFRVLTAH